MERTPVGIFIRQRLMEVGEDYPYRMWKAYCIETERVIPARSFYVYIYWLKELGLIEPSRSSKSKKGFDRVYYRLTPKGMAEESIDLFARPYYYVRLKKAGAKV